MNPDFWTAVFLFSLVFIGLTYFAFPILIVIWGKLFPRPVRKGPVELPVSLIVAAYNEEQGIEKKIKNCLRLNYPSNLLQIIFASDGSTDQTNVIISKYAARHPEIQFLQLPRRGKIFALQEAVSRATGDILIFTDANTHLDPNAINALIPNFADPEIGGVCGNQIHVNSRDMENIAEGEAFYWSLDKKIKMLESRGGSIVSADGALYAIRKSLFRMPDDVAVTDDFALSTAVVEQGYRLVFEPDARAFEPPQDKVKMEFRRKVRIINRGLRGVILRKKLLNPFCYGFYSFTLFFHKIARRIIPFFLMFVFLVSLIQYSLGGWYAFLFWSQVVFYGLALFSHLFRRQKWSRIKILYVPYFYCMANLAALIACLQVMAGRRIRQWQPQRSA
ncbi:MAG: glycosyltransferase family 2 protein [Calditrichia bacterium]